MPSPAARLLAQMDRFVERPEPIRATPDQIRELDRELRRQRYPVPVSVLEKALNAALAVPVGRP